MRTDLPKQHKGRIINKIFSNIFVFFLDYPLCSLAWSQTCDPLASTSRVHAPPHPALTTTIRSNANQCICLHVCVCTHLSQCMYVGHRTTCRSQFFFSFNLVGVPGLDSRARNWCKLSETSYIYNLVLRENDKLPS